MLTWWWGLFAHQLFDLNIYIVLHVKILSHLTKMTTYNLVFVFIDLRIRMNEY